MKVYVGYYWYDQYHHTEPVVAFNSKDLIAEWVDKSTRDQERQYVELEIKE